MAEILTLEGFAFRDGKAHERLDAIDKTLESFNDSLKELPDNVITPELYGAVGDGVTDDTTPIQNMINDNPNSLIFFPKNKYAISDTIHLWSNEGGSAVHLGGAHIIWIGEENAEKSMFQFDKKLTDGLTPPNQPMLYGGILDCNNKAGYGIIIDRPQAIIDSTMIHDFKTAGIMIDIRISTATSISTNAILNKVYITNFYNDYSLEGTTGLIINTPDNAITDCHITRVANGVDLHCAYNRFVNTHICTNHKGSLAELPETHAVRILENYSNNYGVNIFQSCYFDGNKHVFYFDGGNTKIQCNNSFIYMDDGQVTTRRVPAYVVTAKTVAQFDIQQLFVNQNSNYNVFGAFCEKEEWLESSENVLSISRMVRTDSDCDLLSVCNLANDGEKLHVKNGTNYVAGTLYKIGAIVNKLTTSSQSGTGMFELVISNRAYQYQRYLFNKVTDGWDTRILDSYERLQGDKNLNFYVSNTPATRTINGKSVNQYDIYVGVPAGGETISSIRLLNHGESRQSEIYIARGTNIETITSTEGLTLINYTPSN